MPKNKDLKRLARARMQKTGESYTTARAQLIRRKKTATAPGRPGAGAAPPPDHAATAGMGDAAVRGRTGRTWAEWVEVLDGVGAAARPHREIASHLRDRHGLPSWWAQMVTVGYERIRGLRDVGQRRDGLYTAHKSKTMAAPAERLFRAFTEARLRKRWLPGVALAVRKATSSRSVRLAWPDGTTVDVAIAARSGGKSQAAVQHGNLPSKASAERLKVWWGERLQALAGLLVPRG